MVPASLDEGAEISLDQDCGVTVWATPPRQTGTTMTSTARTSGGALDNTILAVIFDKDGTLVDFHRTWGPAVGKALNLVCNGDEAMIQRAGLALGFEPATNTIRPGAPLVAEANAVIHALVAPILDADRFFELTLRASLDSVAPADGLPNVLHELDDRGLKLAIATNDDEQAAVDQMRALGWSDLFDVTVGADSGFGAKPEPDMLLEVLDQLGTPPDRALMVGDTAHDMLAGRRAGMTTMLVTNGEEPTADASNLADLMVVSLADLVPALEAAGQA